jgi:hypothetical protein
MREEGGAPHVVGLRAARVASRLALAELGYVDLGERGRGEQDEEDVPQGCYRERAGYSVRSNPEVEFAEFGDRGGGRRIIYTGLCQCIEEDAVDVY